MVSIKTGEDRLLITGIKYNKIPANCCFESGETAGQRLHYQPGIKIKNTFCIIRVIV